MGNNKLTDIDAELVHETDDAYLIWNGLETFHSGRYEVWVPKEHTEDNEDGTFTMPEWLALEKGLI